MEGKKEARKTESHSLLAVISQLCKRCHSACTSTHCFPLSLSLTHQNIPLSARCSPTLPFHKPPTPPSLPVKTWSERMHVNPVHIPPDLRIASAAFLTACSDHEAKLLMWYFLQLVLNYTEEQAAFETKTMYVLHNHCSIQSHARHYTPRESCWSGYRYAQQKTIVTM